MSFEPSRFKNDRRFTTLNSTTLGRLVLAVPALGRLVPNSEDHARNATRAKESLMSGFAFYGHSSSVLMENALGLPKDTISRTYKWPGQFAKLDPIELNKVFDEYTKGALSYARVKNGDMLNMTPERIEHALTEGAKAYARVCALNDVMVQLNPELADARDAALKARHFPNGMKGEVFLAAGCMYRKHPADIEHFVKESTGIMSVETSDYHRKISDAVMAKAEKYSPPDIGTGWILSPEVAKTVAERVLSLQQQGFEPKPRLYWAQQPVLIDESSRLIDKLKKVFGLEKPKNNQTAVDPMRIAAGYTTASVSITSQSPIDKELQSAAALLGVSPELWSSLPKLQAAVSSLTNTQTIRIPRVLWLLCAMILLNDGVLL